MQTISFGAGYILRSLQNVDSATKPVQSVLNNLFLTVALGVVMIALVVSAASASSIVQPIAAVIAHLRKTEVTGVLPGIPARALHPSARYGT